MSEQLAGARANAQRTYDRRRARSAAETLANIPPNRWDDTTKQMIATLATISAPSRIDDLLADLDRDDVEAAAAADDAEMDERDRVTWDDLPAGTLDLREAFAAEFERMGLTAEERASIAEASERNARPAPPPYPNPRPRPDPDPRPRPEPHPSLTAGDFADHSKQAGKHDNGDYRA